MSIFNKNRTQPLSDVDLIRLYSESGNTDFVGVLFKKYYHLVFGVCLKYLNDKEKSKDATLRIFELLIDRLKEEEITYFSSWLYSVTKNHCLMFIRSENRRINREKKYSEFSELSVELNITDNNEYIETGKLNHSIEKLNPKQKKCIILFYLEGKSYNEIEEITGFPSKMIKSHLQNGKLNLKKMLLNEKI